MPVSSSLSLSLQMSVQPWISLSLSTLEQKESSTVRILCFFFLSGKEKKNIFRSGSSLFWTVNCKPTSCRDPKERIYGIRKLLDDVALERKEEEKNFCVPLLLYYLLLLFSFFFFVVVVVTLYNPYGWREGEKNWRRFGTGEEKQKKKKTKYLFFSLCVWSKSLFFLSFSVGFIEDEWGPVLCVLSHSSLSSSSCRVLYFPVCLRTSSQRRTSLCVCVITFPSAIFRSRTSYSSTRPVVICQLFYRHPGLLPSPLSCVLYILFCVCVSIEDVTFW